MSASKLSLYQAIAEESMSGFLAFNQAGECIFANRVAKQLLNSDSPELASMEPTQGHPQLTSFTTELLKHDGVYQDVLVQGQDPRPAFIVNLGVKSTVVDGENVQILMMQDVTLQKKLQREIMAKQTEIKAAFEELLGQNRQLKELDIAKDRFIALTTHELRTPLSAMIAAAELLKLQLYDNEEQMNEFITMIYEQGMHLQDLVNDILDFAKIQAGKMDVYLEEKDPVALMKSVVDGFEGMAETNKVEIKFEQPNQSMVCYFDPLRLRQIFSNIVNNAIKYNRANGTMTVRFEQKEEKIFVYVDDTGKGIPEEEKSKVFNEFETVGSVSNHHKGTGLGMPISRKLAERMGGNLLFESIHGKGSTFWVELPRLRVFEDEALYQPRPTFDDDLAA